MTSEDPTGGAIHFHDVSVFCSMSVEELAIDAIPCCCFC